MRSAKVETHFSMHNREDGKYGSKTTFVFKEYQQPCLPVKSEEWEPNISQEFLTNIIAKEEENKYFLLNHCDYLSLWRHPDTQGVCSNQATKDEPKLEEV